MSDYHRVQYKVVLTANLVLEILAHETSQKSADFNLHVPRYRANIMIINQQVLLQLTFHGRLLFLTLISRHLMFELLVKITSEF